MGAIHGVIADDVYRRSAAKQQRFAEDFPNVAQALESATFSHSTLQARIEDVEIRQAHLELLSLISGLSESARIKCEKYEASNSIFKLLTFGLMAPVGAGEGKESHGKVGEVDIALKCLCQTPREAVPIQEAISDLINSGLLRKIEYRHGERWVKVTENGAEQLIRMAFRPAIG